MTDWEDLLSEYLHAPEQIEAALHGLSEAQLDLSPHPGEWSIRQIVHHVVDGDDLWALILKQALGEAPQELNLQWYWEHPQENWGDWWAYARREIAPPAGAAARQPGAHYPTAAPGPECPGAIHRCALAEWGTRANHRP